MLAVRRCMGFGDCAVGPLAVKMAGMDEHREPTLVEIAKFRRAARALADLGRSGLYLYLANDTLNLMAGRLTKGRASRIRSGFASRLRSHELAEGLVAMCWCDPSKRQPWCDDCRPDLHLGHMKPSGVYSHSEVLADLAKLSSDAPYFWLGIDAEAWREMDKRRWRS